MLGWLKTTPQWQEYQQYQQSLDAPKRPLTEDERQTIENAMQGIEQTIRDKFRVEAPPEWQHPLTDRLMQDIQNLPQNFPTR